MRPDDDHERMRDMLAAARDALTFASGRTDADLSSDRMFFLALVKAVEIIGEAAVHVSKETRAQYPQIEWQGITGMRNILVHAYGSIDLDELWHTLQADIPALIADLDELLRALDDQTGEADA